jgi:hypothetical protein
MRLAAWYFPLVGVAMAACTARPPASVLVVVVTDMRSPRVTLTASVSRGVMRSDPVVASQWTDRFTLVRPLVHDADGYATVGSFVVYPRLARPSDPVDLDVVLTDGSMTLRRHMRIAFIPGPTRQLPIVLRAACATATTGCTTVPADRCTIAQRCEEQMQTCGDNAQCVSTMVQPMDEVDASTVRDGGPCPDPTQCLARECEVPSVRCENGRTVCDVQPASAGSQCSTGACDGMGRCVPCGSNGEACCGLACRTGLTCVSGRCTPCGARDQRCCGVACLGGLECVMDTCRSCGARGERCCAGAFCNAGTSCAADMICR